MTTYFLIGYVLFIFAFSLYLYRRFDMTFIDALYRTILAWPVILLFGTEQMKSSFSPWFKERKENESNENK